MTQSRLAKRLGTTLALLAPLTLSSAAQAEELFHLKLFFGLALPDGTEVPAEEWRMFEKYELAKNFFNFDINDTVEVLEEQTTHQKVVTMVVEEKQIPKVKAIAETYAEQFEQDRVVLVQTPVMDWVFSEAAK